MGGRTQPPTWPDGAARRGKGRPLRLPEDHAPGGSVNSAPNSRIAWLLATSRLYAGGAGVDRATMADLLQARGITADKTRLSRWESGRQAVPAAVLGGYEAVLGMAPGSLTTVARKVQPNGRLDTSGVPQEDEARDDAELDQLIADVLSADSTGATWCRLADELGRYDLVYLDRATWRLLIGTLTSELSRSSGLARAQRHDALHRLTLHPSSARQTVRELVFATTQLDAQVHPRALATLQFLDHQRLSTLVVAMLHGDREDLASAAFRVCAARLARGQLASSVDAIAAAAARTLHTASDAEWAHHVFDALDALVFLPAAQQERVMVSVPLHLRRRVLTTLAGTELAHPDTARRVSNGLAQTVLDTLPDRSLTEPDLMLERLLREALFHAHGEQRHRASLLLGASPYAPAIADALPDLVRSEDDWLAAQAVTLVPYVGAPRHAGPPWTSVAEDRSIVQAHALRAFADLDTALPDAVHVSAGATARAYPDSTRGEAAVRLLGMNGSLQLADLSADTTRVGRAARWWLEHGPRIRE